MIAHFKKIIRRVLSVQTGVERNQNRVFKIISSLNIQISTIIDVGANHGSWSKTMSKYFPNSKFILIEPNPMLLQSLKQNTKNLSAEIINVGLSDKKGKLKFMISQRDDSSRFGVDPDKLPGDFKEFVDVEVTVLDALENRVAQKSGCIVKIDAEGLDLRVLKGGRSLLKNANIIFIEAGVINSDYENDFFSVVAAMDAMGFRLLDISDMNRTPERERLWLVELCFIRTDIFNQTVELEYI